MTPTGANQGAGKAGLRLWGARLLLLAEGVAWFWWVALQLSADNDSVTEGLSRTGSVAFVTILLVASFRSLREAVAWRGSARKERSASAE